jgi:Ca-activated chloride channel family protein
MRRKTVLAILIALIAAAAQAQSGRKLPQSAQKPGDDAVRLSAEEVLLNVTVIDPYGRQATDLKKEEFIIAEDGKRQDISNFLISEIPVNVVLMLDASGSVAGEIASLRDAAIRFVEELGPKDKISVVDFHTNVELLQDWTAKGEDVRHAISWRFKPGMVRTEAGRSEYGMTSLYDALYLMAEEQLKKVEGRKAIILLTDGDDTSSKVTHEQALAAIIKSNAVVYVVSKARSMISRAPKVYRARFERAEFLMAELARRTGGQLFSPMKDQDLKDVYAQVANELKGQYIISYISTNEARNGQLRRVKVYLTRPGYAPRTRDSYYAPRN